MRSVDDLTMYVYGLLEGPQERAIQEHLEVTDVIAAAAGTTNFNLTIPGATGGGTALTTQQTFASVSDVQTQLVNARVWIGFHYRTSVVNGGSLGNSVAAWSLARFFLPGDDQTD